MDVVQLGLAFRAVRRHLGLRQSDVARRAGISQQRVSDLERGHVGRMSIEDAERLYGVLGARLTLMVSWRGAHLDRLLDEDHAAICRSFAEALRQFGWSVLAEATFSIYGERGSIDLLAWHPATRTLLVVEVKTELVSAEETLRRHDAKMRLASQIGRDRFGVAPASIGGLLVVADTMTNRRRVSRLNSLLDAAYPQRGADVRTWLRTPAGNLRGLVFTSTGGAGTRSRVGRTPRRVRSSDTDASGT